ncbi:phosphocholine-specific phospholipase C [Rhizosphaericola mali]|uniref:phospholipase C n=1 Tax=Rhizosphaericola mali TaxID=2545455 RepID=A0A5P2G7S5_9BACT|nr:phospholipase C, phosphocholine-specific [Rhizosphaericola mali]QES89820.1 phospholipase C, phosphocholine-specific [Rhizosphaericola mali]
MDQSRRSFLKNTSILTGFTGLNNVLPSSIQKAFTINAEPGTTFRDAEHIVFLMQENRSFDHIFGNLKGVRGFKDPRAKNLPNGDKVWLQKDQQGNTFSPFHLDINTTKITWQGGLPHSWKDQTGARNMGKYDQWISNKSIMTMGYYDRNDLPFYYAFADAFTVCDHNFCSSLTGTTPNRLFFWTGNIRPQPDGQSIPAVDNSMAESRDNSYVDWETFPELLEKSGIDWKIYQNEIWTAQLPDHKDYWLGNYGDNAIEYIKRYHVKLSAYFRKNGDTTSKPALTSEEVLKKYESLSTFEKALIDKAFQTNMDRDDAYLNLSDYEFKDENNQTKKVQIPQNDLFYQFRKDVQSGNLPQVSWLVAPQAFSDHTSSPFYGTWYVSEALDILTQNPEVWKKTIFILNYDENDGYFDHLTPFTPPHPSNVETGIVSNDIYTDSDYYDDHKSNNSPIGLGYRVPMIIASPWSKGGFVNSQVFDHTSTLMFLEDFFKHKGKSLYCKNISTWRRSICGNLTSAFRPYNGEKISLPDFEQYKNTIRKIQIVKDKPILQTPSPITDSLKSEINTQKLPASNHVEMGIRPSCSLPYDNYADYQLNEQGEILLKFRCGADIGSAYSAYTQTSYNNIPGKCWDFALSKGTKLDYKLWLHNFIDAQFDINIQGPNGFYRHFNGNNKIQGLDISLIYETKKGIKTTNTGNLYLIILNQTSQAHNFLLEDLSYGKGNKEISVIGNQTLKLKVNLASHHWYDIKITLNNIKDAFWHYAGHVEDGNISISDPLMGS